MTTRRPPLQPGQIEPHPIVHEIPVARLSRAAPHRFDLMPDALQRAAIAAYLGLAELTGLRLRGELVASRGDGWRLAARLTAELSQPCVATLCPVPERVDVAVGRRFVPADSTRENTAIDLDPEADDDPEEFTDAIDIAQIATEELMLALVSYPRAPDTGPVEASFTAPGVEPIDDDAEKPFASLAALREKLERR